MPSYEKNKSSGLWSCRFRETDEYGVVHQRRLSDKFKTKRDAQYAYEDYIKNREELLKQKALDAQKAAPDPGDMLFDDLLRSYMDFTKNRTKESSFYSIESNVKNRLEPFFKGKRIKDITPKMVSDWVENLDYSYKSKSWILSFLSSLYKYGEKYFDIKNIMPKVDRPRNLEAPKEMLIWSPQEFSQMISCVENRTVALYLQTLYIAGCRRGEGGALTWQDVDFNAQTIRINKSVTNKTKEGAYKVTTPKNKGSVRVISMPSFYFNELKEYMTDQKSMLGNEWRDDLFVFGGIRPLPTSTVDRAFNMAIQEAGVKKIRIHDLRHSCASLLISQNISVVAVSKRLGHNNIEQTLNTYSHLMPDDQLKIKSALNELESIFPN